MGGGILVVLFIFIRIKKKILQTNSGETDLVLHCLLLSLHVVQMPQPSFFSILHIVRDVCLMNFKMAAWYGFIYSDLHVTQMTHTKF